MTNPAARIMAISFIMAVLSLLALIFKASDAAKIRSVQDVASVTIYAAILIASVVTAAMNYGQVTVW